jgi:carbon monoxide dehydrogenase subunit G
MPPPRGMLQEAENPMIFTNKFHVPLPMDEAWKLMLDVPRILPCLPGAKLTEVIGDNQYRGSVSVKLGPIKLSFDGQAELVRTDPVAHIAWLKGSGLDPKGRGSAQSEFSFALTAVPGGTDVTVTTDLQLSGSVAQYGRGSGMIAEVAGHILGQFERNLADLVEQGEDASVVNAAAAGGVGTAAFHSAAQPGAQFSAAAVPPSSPSNAPSSQAQPTPPLDAQALLYQSQALLAQAQSVLAATQLALAKFQAVSARGGRSAEPQELNMLAIGIKALWSRVRRAASGLFGGKA